MAQVKIKLPKMLIVLNDTELLKALNSQGLLEKGIGQGKGYLRAISTKKRMAEGFDQWALYEILKGNRSIDSATYDWVEGMDEAELRAGVCSYLERVKQCGTRQIY